MTHPVLQLQTLSPRTQLGVHSYVAHETSTAARRGQWAFYRDLAKRARAGAVFVFADVQQHSSATFEEIFRAVGGDLKRMDFSACPALKTQLMVLYK